MRRASPEIWQHIAPVVTAMGYQFVGAEYGRQDGRALLRIYIDKDAGITLDDCSQVSGQVSAVLDVNDPISEAYVLEVSSPGVDRPLFEPADFQRFTGYCARIRLQMPVQGRRNFKGLLLGMAGDDVLIEQDGEHCRLPYAAIDKAHIVAEV